MDPPKKKHKATQNSHDRCYIQANALEFFLIPDLVHVVMDYLGTGIDGQHREVLLQKCTDTPNFLISVQPGQLLTVTWAFSECRLIHYDFGGGAYESEELGLSIHSYAIHATAEHLVFLSNKGVLTIRGMTSDFFWSHRVLPDTLDMYSLKPCLTSSKNQVFVYRGDGFVQVWDKTDDELVDRGTIRIPGPVSSEGTRMLLTDSNELFLLVSSHSALYVFDTKELAHLRTFQVPLMSADFCVAGKEVFLIQRVFRFNHFFVLDRATGESLRQWSWLDTEDNKSPRSICYDGQSLLVGMANHNSEGHIERVF